MENHNQKTIPLDFIASHAKAMSTIARRKPYVELVSKWAEHTQDPMLGKWFQTTVSGAQMIDVEHMPKVFTPYYRDSGIAAQLIEIVRSIDGKISCNAENWTWAHVMRVMIDEGIIFKITPNRFDTIITSMIPGKGKDNVRHKGDYTIISKKNPWPLWGKTSALDPEEAQDRIICNMIAMEFQPVIRRKISMDY